MLLSFGMQREDVFPADDLGIQQAMQRLYKLTPAAKEESLNNMQQLAKAQPTYACLHLWAWNEDG
jgi:DNA-3-methyladenine glycosylase II